MIKLFSNDWFCNAPGKDLMPLKCHQCEERFMRTKTQIKNAMKPNSKNALKFCCKKCGHLSRTSKTISRECKTCSKIIETTKKIDQKFCNHSCSATYNNRFKLSAQYSNCLLCNSSKGNHNKFCSIFCERRYKFEKTMDSIRSGTTTLEEPAIRTNVKKYLVIEYGHQCMICLRKEHMDQPIPLTCDHIDGDSTNNKIDNFRIICPCCDRQQPTFGGRNIGRGRKSRRKGNKYYKTD